jgi:hypothetical protein
MQRDFTTTFVACSFLAAAGSMAARRQVFRLYGCDTVDVRFSAEKAARVQDSRVGKLFKGRVLDFGFSILDFGFGLT